MPIYESYITADTSSRDPNAPIVLRDEQKDAVKMAKNHFRGKGSKQFLWNAKMRFGKTLSALQLAKEMGVRRTLIVTHRPVVETNFREDFEKIFKDEHSNWDYASRFDDEETGSGSLDALEAKLAEDPNHHFVFFASMQYLRRSSLVNSRPGADDNPIKKQILETDWDLVVVDEAHEGTDTALGKKVIDTLRKADTKMLHLSGTPYKLYNQFGEKEVYTWDYIKEQRAKRDWQPKDMLDTENPYATLPEMKIFTYDLSKLAGSDAVAGGKTFSLSEFFSVWKKEGRRDNPDGMPEGALGRFKYEEAVKNFLDLLCSTDSDNNYPFSTEEYQENFHHTLWVVPGVKEAKALSRMLKEHDIFGHGAFKIINVAGNGDEDEQRADALDKVMEAIGDDPDQTYTITISCGRLTTGVTVKPWTAVFYLKGADSTGASTYMQTIFRVQSADVRNGKMKSQCYVFDFAPDRSLKAVAEASRFAAKAARQSSKNKDKDKDSEGKSDEKQQLEEFLSFCPVISLDGGKMVEFKAESLFEQINHVYNDRIARNGFNDNALYDIDYILNSMSNEELDLIGGLDDVDDTGKRKPVKKKTVFVDINKNGLTPAQRKNGENAEKKDPKDRTPEEQAALEALQEEKSLKREEKKKRLAKLRGIAVRVPLLIFGGRFNNEDSDEITLNNFTRKIDDASWTEFMGTIRVTKDDFNALKRCFNVARFEGAGRLYRQWTREADAMHVEDRIKAITDIHDMFANPDKETVLTPWRVVNMHLSDCLGGYSFWNEEFTGPNEIEVFDSATALIDWRETTRPRFVDRGDVTRQVFKSGDPATKGGARILEINSKTGLYPLYATYSIYRQRKQEFIDAGLIANPDDLTIEEEQVIWDDVLHDNIYVITNTLMAEAITRRTLFGFRNVKHIHIKNDSIVKRAKEDAEALARDLRSVGYWNGTTAKAMLKFSAVIGNPPYQEVNQGNGNGADPLYHLFIDLGMLLADKGTLIHPARFLFKAGKTPKDWNEKMLSSKHYKVVGYWADSSAVFPSVDVKGGIATTYWDKDADFEPIGTYSAYQELSTILKKVRNTNDASFSTIVGPREAYGLTDILYEEHPDMLGRQSKGHKYSLSANILEIFPELFTEEETDESIQIYGRYNNQRGYRWVKDSYVSKPDNFYSYKVFVPEANGTGAIGEVLSTPVIGVPVIGVPVIGHTDTFLSIGKFASAEEASACLKYVKSKFARCLLGTLKATQHNPRDTWANVPLQDFTSASDIDWSKDVADIDRQLYAKYGLDAEEIDFIERMIKPME